MTKPRIRVKAFSFPVSDGVPLASRETEMEPAATLAYAPSGFIPEIGPCGFDLSIPAELLRDASNVPAYPRRAT